MGDQFALIIFSHSFHQYMGIAIIRFNKSSTVVCV